MLVEQLPLARQLEMVFRELKEELASIASGTIFVQIRNNLIGKFGVKHDPLTARDGEWSRPQTGLSEQHQQDLRRMGLISLQFKKWTHGEIRFQFALKNNALSANVLMESNYNMANLMSANNGRRVSRY